ncbi:hypothetical protein [Agrobacterium larrymoorei]|uniref:Uncharacterized protein n=2 Tax=Agrobacterium larrymoorei TaxID=160699 RepID=A0A4D7DUC3_9HYPH|nr:hypothetical protein [Agrobacterium larrymoorei]QCJ00602.1 hypothetical protein CFBP5473_21620 [Agrobacterium larrymoorei]
MADSENSRTLPTISCGKKRSRGDASKKMPHVITRRNLLSVAARVLEERLAEIPRRTVAGPTRVSELWPNWWNLHQKRLHATAVRKKRERQMRDEVGLHSEVRIEVVGEGAPRIVRSLKEITALRETIGAGEVAKARALLRQRQRQWQKANQRIGYTAALLSEEHSKSLEGIAGRVLLVMQPYHLIEIAAKLHCLLVMKDPGLQQEADPWPHLRIMLKQIVQPRLTREPSSLVLFHPPVAKTSVRQLDALMAKTI